MSMHDEARRLDAADPLAGFRERFVLPEGVIYLDGNSLGALPKATAPRIARLLQEEWGEGLIRSWNEVPDGGPGWVDLPARVGAKIAALIGAGAHEVIACDSTSVNLFKLIAAALMLRPGRRVVLSEPGNFPTNLYMTAGLERQGLCELRLVPSGHLEEALGQEDVALLLLTHVHYRTGAMHDMAALTRAAHEAGVPVLWDLSHSAGAVELALSEHGVDFAVGCGYKYLNGGPGAPAFAYVAERHHAELVQPLTGWFGHAQPFAFTDAYEPAPGMARMLAGTPPVLGLTALDVGVDLVAEIGVARLAAKSRALSAFFLQCLHAEGVELECVSPLDPFARGSQLSFRHKDAYALSQALIARGVIGDFRAPDVLRLGFAPAYLSFADIAAAAGHVAGVLRREEWRREAYRTRAAIT